MNWEMMVMDPIQTVMDKAFLFVPRLIGVLVILVVGWAVAMVLKNMVRRGLTALKADDLVAKSGLKEILEKGQIRESFSGLIANIIYWLVMLVVFVSAVNAFGLTVTAELLDKLVLYLPKVVAAIFIGVLGLFFATLMSTIVTTASANAGIKSANGLGQTTKAVVVVFAVLTALEQLEIGTRIIEMAIFVLLSSAGLAISIAFGLGAKDLAARSLEEWLKKFKG